jgi:hypothetical protein
MHKHEPRSIWCNAWGARANNDAKTVIANALLCKRVILLIIANFSIISNYTKHLKINNMIIMNILRFSDFFTSSRHQEKLLNQRSIFF